ncbi:hypothetical protein EMEDMD4_790128 [Sinorhizobium medicae]|uniref:Uncharacterized protein n=1 Tax=Sinorhizobium medicae TaxID=110321 RepID=A0A508X816_9HYPH|nr:hypothetical protein EMEDMD4_790128 [Sinorhizobium medicae]
MTVIDSDVRERDAGGEHLTLSSSRFSRNGNGKKCGARAHSTREAPHRPAHAGHCSRSTYS